METKLPDLAKLLPNLSDALDPFHPDNLEKPKKTRTLLEVYLGPRYKERIRARLQADPGLLPAEIKQKLAKGGLNEYEQYAIVERMMTL